jgi:nicotinamidase-related amidase
MLIDTNLIQLLCIDLQAGSLTSIHEREQVVANAHRLCQIAQLMGVPIVGSEQNPRVNGATEPRILPFYGQTFEKMQFSAVDEDLVEALTPAPKQNPAARGASAKSLPKKFKELPPEDERDQIVLCGVESHVAVLQTALDLVEQDFIVWVVTDACGSHNSASRDAAYDRLAANACELITTEMFAYECLRTAAHEQHDRILALLT